MLTRRFVIGLIAVAATSFGCAAERRVSMSVQDAGSRVFLNQHWIAEGRAVRGLPPLEAGDQGQVPVIREAPDPAMFDDVDSVIRRVWESLPPVCHVYPTERYFYYRLPIGHRTVSGNLRFTDIERGLLHVGYFNALDVNEARSKTFGSEDGLTVIDESNGKYRVSLFGQERLFNLVLSSRERPRDLSMFPSESFITGVLDESGYPLAMIWDEENGSFLFTAVPERGLPEDLIELGDGLLLGEVSRFVFLRQAVGEADRLLLVGVRAGSIRANDYYDGPFDQVPPDLDIKTKIERAYPYVALQGGVDTHGNFTKLSGSRVAISPYQEYDSLSTLVQILAGMRQTGKVEQAIGRALTYESKRDFHRRFEGGKTPTLGDLIGASIAAQGSQAGVHHKFLSQGWPANHSASSSSTWPDEHIREVSGTWPPNHQPALSSGAQVAEPRP